MQLTSHDSGEIPQPYLNTVINYLNGFRNDTVDFSKPYLKPYFANIYVVFIVAYSTLILTSVLANLAMVYHIFRYDMHKDPTCAFLINIAIANVLHVVFPFPITLAVILLHNWIFGQFICFCLPMLQDTPIHVCMMTYLLIAGDRYRLLSDPRKPRIPAFVCALGTWFFAVCIALPYPIYMSYLDYENFGEAEASKLQIQGLQMCISNLADDIQEYMRSLFIGTYIAPLTILAYIYVKSGQELQHQVGPLAVYSRQSSQASNEIALTIQGKRGSESVGTGGTTGFSNLSASYDLEDAELDVQKEKRTQKYLIFMVTAFAICLCPLEILRLARLAVEETYENSKHFDITYLTIIWLAFLPGLIIPVLYASWQMSRPAKERLRGYFRFSNRRHTRVCEDGQRPSSRHSLHPNRVAGGSNSGGTPRSRTGSSNSGNGSTTAVVAGGSSSDPRSPKFNNDNAAPLDSPDLISSTSYSPYNTSLMP